MRLRLRLLSARSPAIANRLMSAESTPLLNPMASNSTAGVDPARLVYTPVDEIPRVCEGVRAVFASGRTRPLEWRYTQIRGIKRLVEENGDAIAAALASDLRRPLTEALLYETMVVVAEAQHALSELKSWTAPRSVDTPPALLPAYSYLQPEPLGVVCVIAPWNFPVMLVLSPLVGVLAAGNTAVIKPSELSPACSVLLQQLLPRYVDPSAVCVIQGGVDETSRLLAQRFDHVLYTGGGAVAQHVMRAAAAHLTPVTLELGGKCPAIIDSDASIQLAAKRIISGKINAGQACVSPDYVLVHRDVEDAFISAAVRTVREFYGEDPKASPDLGRIINRRHFARVKNLIETSGGKIECGGAAQADVNDLYIPPTIIREPSRDAPVMQEEIFGPVLPVIGVSSVQEAVDYVNAHPKPLAAYVFTASNSTAKRVIDTTSSGGFTVNDVVMHAGSVYMPFGGVGASGMGAYHGQYGFDRFSHLKPVMHIPTFVDPGALRYPPYTMSRARLLARLMVSLPALPKITWKDLALVGLSAAVAVLAYKYSQVAK